MKKRTIINTIIACTGLLLGAVVFAQQSGSVPGGDTRPAEITPPATPSTTPGDRPRVSASTPRALYASSLIGASVKSHTGESVGKINELVIDPQQAQIKTAIVSVGGMLGIGAKDVAVPWTAVQMASDGEVVIVARAKEELEKAPDWKKPEAGPTSPGKSAVPPASTSQPGTTR